MTVPEQIERLCTSISQCLATVPDMPSGLREAAGNFLRSLLRNYPCGEARAGAVPEAVEHLCTLLSQCPATVPDMPSGLREAADNLRRSLLRNYPATQAAPSDVPPEMIFPLSDEALPASAQAKIDRDIDERLKQLQYAAEAGSDTLRKEEELRVLAGGDRTLENRIAEAIRRGEKAREERNRLKMLLNQGLLSPAVGEYWDELPRRAGWFIRKASKEIRWHAAKELQSLLKKQNRDAGQWLARAKARFDPVLNDLELPQTEEVAAPVIPENTEHRLDRMPPAQCWHIYIDESGQAFSEDEARQGAEGRVVAVCMRDGELLPEQRLHCTDSSPAEVLTALAELLKHPCGILGLSQTTLHVRSEDGWLQSIRELVKWIWRLLPLPDNGQPSHLRIHIEQRGQYGVATDTIFGKDMLRAELTRENPERAAKIRILSFDFIDKNDLRSGWADVASYCWGSGQPRIREGLSRSGLLDTCLSRISPAVEVICHDIMTGKNPDGTAWQRLMEAHTPRSPFTGMALNVLRQRCLASPELWTPYAQAMQNYLLSKSYELSVLERMAEWLEGMKNPGREARYFWYSARLAHLNHKGDVASDTLLEVKHHLALLAPEMGATDPVAELHVALRLAVSDANAFDFAGAESRLARWNPAEGGRLPDTPLWRGKVLSSLGQYRAFQRDLPGGCRYFRQALEQFSLLPEEEAARQLPQTGVYLAIAAMDRSDLTDEQIRPLVESALGRDIPSFAAAMTTEEGLKNRYGHYLLTRYLSRRGSDEERAAYLRKQEDWTQPGVGCGQGHPWPLIQYHRWLMTDPDDTGLRERLAKSLCESMGSNMPPFSTVELITWCIVIAMGIWQPAEPAVARRLRQLAAAMPESAGIIGQMLAAGGDERLAQRLLPFNYI